MNDFEEREQLHRQPLDDKNDAEPGTTANYVDVTDTTLEDEFNKAYEDARLTRVSSLSTQEVR